MVSKSINWKYNINDNILDFNRNLTIIDREIREYIYKKDNKEYVHNYQYYKYHCNVCGFENWILLSNLNKGVRCSCCSNASVIKGVNDIATIRPDLVKYFVDVNDAYNHTVMSGKKVKCKCPICGTEKYVLISNLTGHGFSCNKCSDGISYPEKFVASVLSQLKIEFKKQYEINNFKYKYDFYLPQYNTIIETHGEQHYTNTFLKTTLEEVQGNDLKKKNVAIKNNITNYIVLDCRKSEINHIKNSICNNNFFSDNFNLGNINWELCHKESLRNKLIEICEYWNKYSNEVCVSDIMKIFSIPRTTVLKYLHIGTEIGLCLYDKSIENKKAGKKRTGKNNPMFGKKVTEEKRKELLGYAIEYGMKKAKKICQCSYDTSEIVEVHLSINSIKKKYGYSTYSISECCKGNRRSAYGYKWYYYDDYIKLKNDNI